MERKVAIIDTLGAHGGSFHLYVFGQSIGLIKNGIDVSIYTNNVTQDPGIAGLRFFRFYKNIFDSNSQFKNGLRWLFGSLKSILHARFSGVSIFHFHLFYTNILVLYNLLLVKILFGKVVVTIHDVHSFTSNEKSLLIQKIIYKLTDLILTHNNFSRLEIQKLKMDLSSDIHIVPHGNYIPFIGDSLDKDLSRNFLKISKDKKVVLFFGMIKQVKGLEIVLRSLKNVISMHPDILLVIAGKVWKNDFSVYQQIIDKEGLQKYCLIHNKFIKQDDVPHYYAASDLVVLPYKRIYQSGVLMMALSYERPVLVSDLPPLKEVITDGKSGFIFKSEDVESLSNKLRETLSNTHILEQVRINGFNLVNNKYDWHEIGRITKEAYKTID